MTNTDPQQALETIQNTKKIIEEIFKIVGHDEAEAKTNTDDMVESILHLAISALVAQKIDPAKQAEVVQKLNQVQSPAELTSQLQTLFLAEDVDSALTAATQKTFTYYFEKIMPSLSQTQQDSLNQLINSLK